MLYMLLIVAVAAKPLRWTRSRAPEPEPTSTTLVPWKGTGFTAGAFVLSRINLKFIPTACNKYSATLVAATEVVRVLVESQLTNAHNTQKKKFGYSLVKLETEVRNTLYYLTDLVLCSGQGGELWTNFINFRDQVSIAWKL